MHKFFTLLILLTFPIGAFAAFVGIVGVNSNTFYASDGQSIELTYRVGEQMDLSFKVFDRFGNVQFEQPATHPKEGTYSWRWDFQISPGRYLEDGTYNLALYSEDGTLEYDLVFFNILSTEKRQLPPVVKYGEARIPRATTGSDYKGTKSKRGLDYHFGSGFHFRMFGSAHVMGSSEQHELPWSRSEANITMFFDWQDRFKSELVLGPIIHSHNLPESDLESPVRSAYTSYKIADLLSIGAFYKKNFGLSQDPLRIFADYKLNREHWGLELRGKKGKIDYTVRYYSASDSLSPNVNVTYTTVKTELSKKLELRFHNTLKFYKPVEVDSLYQPIIDDNGDTTRNSSLNAVAGIEPRFKVGEKWELRGEFLYANDSYMEDSDIAYRVESRNGLGSSDKSLGYTQFITHYQAVGREFSAQCADIPNGADNQGFGLLVNNTRQYDNKFISQRMVSVGYEHYLTFGWKKKLSAFNGSVILNSPSDFSILLNVNARDPEAEPSTVSLYGALRFPIAQNMKIQLRDQFTRMQDYSTNNMNLLGTYSWGLPDNIALLDKFETSCIYEFIMRDYVEAALDTTTNFNRIGLDNKVVLLENLKLDLLTSLTISKDNSPFNIYFRADYTMFEYLTAYLSLGSETSWETIKQFNFGLRLTF
ncbi:hypothetical protein KAH81_08495 [bacterium]|nr:hypothetical protein [bacterium]